jgi:hypothetical protein
VDDETRDDSLSDGEAQHGSGPTYERAMVAKRDAGRDPAHDATDEEAEDARTDRMVHLRRASGGPHARRRSEEVSPHGESDGEQGAATVPADEHGPQAGPRPQADGAPHGGAGDEARCRWRWSRERNRIATLGPKWGRPPGCSETHRDGDQHGDGIVTS